VDAEAGPGHPAAEGDVRPFPGPSRIMTRPGPVDVRNAPPACRAAAEHR
jgi:hypothetical protein